MTFRVCPFAHRAVCALFISLPLVAATYEIAYGAAPVVNTTLCSSATIAPGEDIGNIERLANSEGPDQAYFQAVLAGLHRRGYLVEKDFAKAYALLKRALQGENRGIAHYELWVIYDNGYGVEKDKEKAKTLAQQAYSELSNEHDGDDPRVLLRLGVLYSEDVEGIPKDVTKATKFDRRAAESGHWLGQYRYGLHLKRGTGVEKDLAEAEVWLCRSARQGFPIAMTDLAVVYRDRARLLEEKGTTRIQASEDYGSIKTASRVPLLDESRAWFMRSAEYSSDPSDWIRLGQMFENGRLFARNYEKAIEWYKKAAQEENSEGQYRLALLYWFNMNLSESDFKGQARKLFEAAVRSGHEQARNMIEYLNEYVIRYSQPQ